MRLAMAFLGLTVLLVVTIGLKTFIFLGMYWSMEGIKEYNVLSFSFDKHDL